MDIVRAILENRQDAIRSFYEEIKPAFLQYMTKYDVGMDIRLDAFHEAMIAFMEYCRSGRYDSSKSSPKSMIYRMGSAYLINRLRKEKKIILKEETKPDGSAEWMQIYAQENLNPRESQLKDGLKKLGEKCQQLLALFYYQNIRIEGIMKRMKYKNENTVSSHKSRCIKQLREIIKA